MYEILRMANENKNLNDLIYTDYYMRLMLMARSVFKWNNLPNGMDERWIERYLFNEGKCVFFKDREYGFMVAKCSPFGNLNYYDEPTLVTPVATNFSKRVTLENDKECVIIRNNDIMLPTAHSIRLFAMRLANVTRTIDVNINAQKTPILIKGSQRQQQTLINLYRKWSGNEPVIYGDKNLEANAELTVLNTEAPIVFPQLQIQKHAEWNEAMTFLGINNANMDKRERLVDDEVQANNEQIDVSADVFLKARERACERINELFDLNISVERRSDKENEKVVEEGTENDDV